MSGTRNIVITGANSGVGFQTAKALFAHDNNIIFGSRNEQRNASALQQILKAFPNSKGSVKCYKLDLSKRASIEQFAQFVKRQFEHVDVLINNAGLIMSNRQVNELGVQMTMATNHFGHFLLTYLLFPLIKNSKEARIINVSSAVHQSTSQSTVEDLPGQHFSTFGNYKKSKLANVQFTVGLATRLSSYPNIKAMSLHPGIVESGFGHDNCLIKFFMCCCNCIYVNNQTGARTSIFLSELDFKQLRSGEYYDNDTTLVAMNELGRNTQHVQTLWKASEKLFGVEFKI